MVKIHNIEKNTMLHPNIELKYYRVYLTSNKTGYTKKIHRLVAHVFVKKTDPLYNYVNHIDEDKLNNHYTNLEWTSHIKNIQHSCGKKVIQIDKKTNEIIKKYNCIAAAYRDLGKTYGSNIRWACNGRRKTAYGYKWKFD